MQADGSFRNVLAEVWIAPAPAVATPSEQADGIAVAADLEAVAVVFYLMDLVLAGRRLTARDGMQGKAKLVGRASLRVSRRAGRIGMSRWSVTAWLRERNTLRESRYAAPKSPQKVGNRRSLTNMRFW
jgi:hypothetical protein